MVPPQSGKLAHDELVKYLKLYGHEPMSCTLGLWADEDQNIAFTLVVDDFGVKHSSMQNLYHLTKALKDKHNNTIDHSGGLHIGVTLKWKHKKHEVHYSMSTYYSSILKLFSIQQQPHLNIDLIQLLT